MKKEVFDLSKFDEYREGNRLEVKKANGGLPNSLWDTYSSFSNCNGGAIILGVKERNDGSWCTTHLQNENKLLKDFWDIINNRGKVNINLLREDDVEVYEKDGDVILVIYVHKADRVYKPVYINNDLFGGTFRRDHEGDYHCSEAEVKGMLRDQAERGMDSKILLNMDLDIFYHETVKSFRSRHTAVNPDHVWHKLDDEPYLERIGAAAISDVDGRLHPTVAGLLMFGEEYKIRNEFPEYFLDYREELDPSIRWTDRLESSSGEWSGNLVDFFFQMERKLLRDLKKPFKLEGITRIDETPVHKAIREALANCIANADFNFPRGIVIKKSVDSIVIENPGSILTGRTQMLKGGISEPRNKNIMKMFNLIRVGERAGSGVPDIFSVWDEEGWVLPSVEEQFKPDRTKLTLTFKEKQAEKPESKRKNDSKQAEKPESKRKTDSKQAEKPENKRISDSKQAERPESKRKTGSKQAEKPKTIVNKNQILEYLTANEKAKTAELASLIGLSVPRTRVLIAELVSDNRITSEGDSRSRVYRLKK